MRKQIEQLIHDLQLEAMSNRRIAGHGSPVTSMNEDAGIGMVAEEQERIAGELLKILRQK